MTRKSGTKVKKTMGSAVSLGGVLLFIAIIVGGPWLVKRWWNSSLYYSGVAEDAVCEMVEHEYLTKEGREKCD